MQKEKNQGDQSVRDVIAQIDCAIGQTGADAMEFAEKKLWELRGMLHQREQWIFAERLAIAFENIPWLTSATVEWDTDDCCAYIGGWENGAEHAHECCLLRQSHAASTYLS